MGAGHCEITLKPATRTRCASWEGCLGEIRQRKSCCFKTSSCCSRPDKHPSSCSPPWPMDNAKYSGYFSFPHLAVASVTPQKVQICPVWSEKKKLLIFYIYSLCVLIQAHATGHMWRSEGSSWDSIVPLLLCGSRVIRLSSKCLHPLSHATISSLADNYLPLLYPHDTFSVTLGVNKKWNFCN